MAQLKELSKFNCYDVKVHSDEVHMTHVVEGCSAVIWKKSIMFALQQSAIVAHIKCSSYESSLNGSFANGLSLFSRRNIIVGGRHFKKLS